MYFKYLLTILIGFFLGIIFLFGLKKLSLRYKILVPNGIPLIGGIAMGISFLLTSLFAFSFNIPNQIKGVLFASFVILIMGIVDDFRELSVTAKFLIQFIAASLLILFGIKTQIIYIGAITNIIITLIWVLGITNALNHLDIIDGLAISIAMVVCLGFFVISCLNGDSRTAFLSLALTGAGFSFLIFNLPPAKVYMGNTGSHFLGLVLASVALIISYASLERKTALLTPLVILWLPIFDTAFLVFMRLRKKKMPFKKSNDHLVLRLLASGYSKKRALLIMLGLGLFFCFSGILLSRVTNWAGITIFIFVILVSVYINYRMDRVKVNG